MDITDPADPAVQASLAWSCDICQVGKGELCRNPIHPDKPLPGRVVHLARLVDRRRERGGDDE